MIAWGAGARAERGGGREGGRTGRVDADLGAVGLLVSAAAVLSPAPRAMIGEVGGGWGQRYDRGRVRAHGGRNPILQQPAR